MPGSPPRRIDRTGRGCGTRPVAARGPSMSISLAELQKRSPPTLTRRDDHPATREPTYMVATGFECSYPTVQGGKRRDELHGTRHYELWRDDFELCREIGARYIRYGIPYYRTHLGPGRYDWTFADEVLPHIWDRGLIPIVDLCHFGIPDWVGSFQNTDWPPLFAEYCAAFAERYPWIKFYTPVNEMLVCCHFSAKVGASNEQEKSEKSFIRAHANQCLATLLAIGEILKRRPDAVFIQSEVAEAYVQLAPEAKETADFHNEFRFLTFDHLYGRAPDGQVQRHLLEHGLRDDGCAGSSPTASRRRRTASWEWTTTTPTRRSSTPTARRRARDRCSAGTRSPTTTTCASSGQ
jgi:beta-glucosidase/6-phospho-beta-glucosidase/beta-galactosidase